VNESLNYYVIQVDNKFQVRSTIANHREMKEFGFNVVGCFGRLDYAEHWMDYKNGIISESDHKMFLHSGVYEPPCKGK